MPALPNIRHENFSKLIARGVEKTEAFIKVGYSENNVDTAVSRLMRDPAVMARIAELKEHQDEIGAIKDYDSDLIIEPDKIDEKWVLIQLQELLQMAKEQDSLKIARETLVDIAAIKGIGANNQASSKDNSGNAKPLPPPTEVSLKIALENLEKHRGSLDELLASAEDITSESQSDASGNVSDESPGKLTRSNSKTDRASGDGASDET